MTTRDQDPHGDKKTASWDDDLFETNEFKGSFFNEPANPVFDESPFGQTLMPSTAIRRTFPIGIIVGAGSVAALFFLGLAFGWFRLGNSVSKTREVTNQQLTEDRPRRLHNQALAIANVLRQYAAHKHKLDNTAVLESALQPDRLLNVINELRAIDCSSCPDEFRTAAMHFIQACESLNLAWTKARGDALVVGIGDLIAGEANDTPKAVKQAYEAIQIANQKVTECWHEVERSAASYQKYAN